MMKMTTTLNTCLGLLLGVPLLAGQDEEGLLGAIEATEVALEQLASIQQGLEQGDPGSILELMRLTEGPLASGVEQEQILTNLRAEVGRLEMLVERAQSDPGAARSTDSSGGQGTIQRNPWGVDPSSWGANLPRNTHSAPGTSSELLETLSPQMPGSPSSVPNTPRPKQQFEDQEDFVADPLGYGRLLYKAGKYQEALDLLETQPDQVEAVYWSAVCLERLGREREAMERFQQVIGTPGAGPFASSATNDLAFLRWKQEYFERRKQNQR